MTWGRCFYLWLGLVVSRLVFVAYGKLAWSYLLTAEIQFGLFCLRSKIGLFFFTYSSASRNLIWSFLFAVSPTVSKKDEP